VVQVARLALASALLETAGAFAQERAPAGISLSWTAGPGCPDRDAVLARIRSLLASSQPSPRTLTATGVVEATPTGDYSLALTTTQDGATHQRALTAPTCDSLADAGALVLALALDPSLLSHPQPEPQPEPAFTPPPLDPPTPPPPPRAPDRTAVAPRTHASHSGLAVAGLALADLGTLPRTALGAAMALGLAFDALRLELLLGVLPPVRTVIAEQPERGGDLMLFAGGPRGCYEPWRAPLGLGGCAGFEVGGLAGESFGATEADGAAIAPWLALRAGVVARLELADSLTLRLDLEGLVPTARPRFLIERLDAVHQPGPVSARLLLGLEVAFLRRNRPEVGTK
jgi:hypothetical protein